MNRQEAIKALTIAGRTEEVEEVIRKHIDQAKRAYAGIRSEPDRTEDWVRRELAAQFEAHNQQLSEELVKMAGAAVKTDRGDAIDVFGVAGIPGDPASLIISRRDAGDRVAEIGNAAELRELLARATRSGDEVLARAVAERALELRDAKTLEQFAEDRPGLEAAVERLWDAQRREDNAVDVSWNAAILMSQLRPEELARSA